MRLDETETRSRFAAGRVARLATVDSAGRPHIVPVVFTVRDSTIFTAVDDKPKAHTNLARLRNIAAHTEVSLLVDHYADDWSQLWWARADGDASVVADPVAIDWLAEKYPQYQRSRPPGPVVRIDVSRWLGWSASG
jgi:PPOX class probable F420-dependent enzyme